MSRRAHRSSSHSSAERVAPGSSAADLGDKPCIYCGGSLQDVTAADRCPTCGKLAIDSLLGSHLRDVDQYWLRMVIRGTVLMSVAFSLFVVFRAFQVLEALDPNTRWFDHRLLRYLIGAVDWITAAVAAWMITAPEPSDQRLARRRGVARTARVCALIAAGFAVVPRAYLLHLQDLKLFWPAVATWTMSIALCHLLLWIVLRRLIDRTPRLEVRRRLVAMAWLCVPVLIIASPLAWWLAPHAGGDSSRHAALRVATLAVLMAYHVASVVVLMRSTHAIRRTVGYWS